MATATLLTSPSPAGLLVDAARAVAEAGPRAGWCLVVPRAHLARELTALLLAHQAEGDAFDGHVVMTQDELLAHFGMQQSRERVLTPLQVRQVIADCVLHLHGESAGAIFAGHVQHGRVAEGLLRSLTRLFNDLEPFRYTAVDLRRALTKEHVSTELSQRVEDVVRVFEYYLERLEAAGYTGPLGDTADVLDAIARGAAPLPPGRDRFSFIGLDGAGRADTGVQLMQALLQRRDVAEVRCAIVLPTDLAASKWTAHGNDVLYKEWAESVGARTITTNTEAWLDETYGAAHDLRALAADPFAYRLGEVDATGAVQGVRVPDTQMELEWVAADIKRRWQAGEVALDQVAVIARDMARRADDVERALALVGLPAYASREQAIATVPAVQALLTLVRLAAFGWRVGDVVAAAECPYLPLGLNPTLLSRVGLAGTTPKDAADWRRRVQALAGLTQADLDREQGGVRHLPADSAPEAAHLAVAFETFAAQVERLFPAAGLTAAAWVAAVVEATTAFELEAQVYQTSSRVPREQRTALTRTDLDGLNAFVRALYDWERGRKIAGRPGDPLTARAFYAELEAIGAQTPIRASSYARRAVQLLEPRQAALRQWDAVYVIGLVDGVFPAYADLDEHALSEEERRALKLPVLEQRMARERLYFHLAVATARRSLTLVTANVDDRGKALVMSPFLGCLELRVRGFRVEERRVDTLVPKSEADVRSLRDVHLLAAQRYRQLAEAAPTPDALRAAAEADPVVAPWLAEAGTARELRGWTVERLRASLDRVLALDLPLPHDLPELAHTGLLPAAAVPAAIAAPDAAFSPSEFTAYKNCHFRFFAARAFGLRAGQDADDDHDEAAAFGTLQHTILERLYRHLLREHRLPPADQAAVDAALADLETIARACVREHTASAHEQLWELDFDFVIDVLRNFVRRDLQGMLDARRPDAPRLRTRLLALEASTGTGGAAIPVTVGGTTFHVRGTMDRVEEIADERLPAEAQGLLVIRDYKSSRSSYVPKVSTYLKGDSLQLPLYAIMAKRHFDRRVFGVGELRTSMGADPDLLAQREVMPDGEGGIALVRHQDADNPLLEAERVVKEKVAGFVDAMRAGHFAPQPKRSCFGCQFKDICRSARMADPAAGRRRAHMPLAVSAAAFDALDGEDGQDGHDDQGSRNAQAPVA